MPESHNDPPLFVPETISEATKIIIDLWWTIEDMDSLDSITTPVLKIHDACYTYYQDWYADHKADLPADDPKSLHYRLTQMEGGEELIKDVLAYEAEVFKILWITKEQLLHIQACMRSYPRDCHPRSDRVSWHEEWKYFHGVQLTPVVASLVAICAHIPKPT